jgi:hypothetical protein
MPNEPTVLRSPGGTEVRVSDADQINIQTTSGVGILINGHRIRVVSQGCTIEVDGAGITLSGAQVTVDAMILSARTIRCDTVIANLVVGSSYTPGAGNVW